MANNNFCMSCPHYVKSQPPIAVVGFLTFDLSQSRASWRGVDIDFTVGEFKVVARLATQPGHWQTYRGLYDVIQSPGFAAGPGSDGYRNNVRSMVKRIRNKFKAHDAAFDQISNYSGFGYCWKLEPKAAPELPSDPVEL